MLKTLITNVVNVSQMMEQDTQARLLAEHRLIAAHADCEKYVETIKSLNMQVSGLHEQIVNLMKAKNDNPNSEE